MTLHRPGGKCLRIVISRDNDDVKLYKNPLQWEGIKFRSKARGGRAMPFKEVLSKINIARAAIEDV